jgi:anion-transporting  ArsA/GET3 family ATPase
MKFLTYVPLLFMFLYPSISSAQACSANDAQAADEYVDQLVSWQAVDTMQQKYHPCDDGSIAEGTSDLLAKLLVTQWHDLASLHQLMQRNPKLKPFVLRHIDSTLDSAVLEKIQTLSAQQCPAKNLSRLCNDLHKAASAALK